jgi:hypothetical protein
VDPYRTTCPTPDARRARATSDDVALSLLVLHRSYFGLPCFNNAWCARLVIVIHGMAFRGVETIRHERIRLGGAGVYIGPLLEEETVLPIDEPPPGWLGGRLDWHEIGAPDLRLVMEKLAAAGLPGEPELREHQNVSADYRFETIVSGVVNERPFGVQLSRNELGYSGADADAFSSLLRTVLTVARLDCSAARWHELFHVSDRAGT